MLLLKRDCTGLTALTTAAAPGVTERPVAAADVRRPETRPGLRLFVACCCRLFDDDVVDSGTVAKGRVVVAGATGGAGGGPRPRGVAVVAVVAPFAATGGGGGGGPRPRAAPPPRPRPLPRPLPLPRLGAALPRCDTTPLGGTMTPFGGFGTPRAPRAPRGGGGGGTGPGIMVIVQVS